MSKKVTVDVTVRMTIVANDDANISEIIDDMDYEFTLNSDEVDLTDTEITNQELIDVS